MTKVRVFDLEADSLNPTKIHCLCFRSLDGKEEEFFGPDGLEAAKAFMDTCDVLIGHNVISYDFPAIKKVMGYEYKGKKVDTLLMSRLQCPNRQIPLTARGDLKAMKSPHGLGCWGYRVGRGKPEVDESEWKGLSDDELEVINFYENG